MNVVKNDHLKVGLRWTEPDFLRALAFSGVVMQHILGAWARRTGVGPRQAALISICFELVRFAVPLFVFLFGMMLARSAVSLPGDLPGAILTADENSGFKTGRYYKRRLLRLAVPYIFWSIYYIWSSEGSKSFRDLPRLLLSGGAAYHLWYVPMILQFVLLAPVFVRLFRRIEESERPAAGWAVLLTAGFLWLILIAVCGKLQPGGTAFNFIWRHQTAFFASWLVYFACGAFCGSHYEAFCRFTRRFFPYCLPLTAAAFILIVRADLRADAAAGSVVFNVVGLQQWTFAPIVLVVILCLQRAAMRLAESPFLRRAASFIGTHSYRAYLSHVAFIFWFNKRLVARFSFLPGYYLLLFVLTFFCSLALAFALDTAVRPAERLIGSR